LKKKIQPVFEDHRGIILDILEGESVDAITYISFKNRAIRANHYHKDTTQWNYVLSGKLKYLNKVINKDLLEDSLTEVCEETLYPGDFCVSKPWEAHAFQGIEDSEMLVLTKGPRSGMDYEKDTFRLKKPLIPYED
jgi:quercetin dioxygenase-like cupin family protein|tara:strand:- start:11090 stop:11497 length:408 start_codon:yes stop_codon:yes gene_type:complete